MPDVILEVTSPVILFQVTQSPVEFKVSGGRGAQGPMGPQGEQGLPGSSEADTSTLTAAEALDAGMFVNIYEDVGVAKMRKASSVFAREAHGYVKVDVPNGNPGVAWFAGENEALSGLIPGQEYWLSNTGGVQDTPPVSTGQIVQVVGVAISDTVLRTERNMSFILT